jgi:oligopeptide/dipeptide ABC transporter ATP-binding protein
MVSERAGEPMESNPILQVTDLHTSFHTREGVVNALNGINLSLWEGQILGLVGESGSGKTVTALSILRLVPFPGRIDRGEVIYDGKALGKASEAEMRQIRGKEISVVFQDPTSSLNPVLTIGTQMEEGLLAHFPMRREEVRRVCADLLWEMGLPDPIRLMEMYPFQISGGMAQRVMIALAMAPEPRILIADEPTSNLDVTLQAEILDRFKRLQREHNTSVLLITHDMGVVAQMADEVSVMYAGTIMEQGGTRAFFKKPQHPYSWGLFRAMPRVDQQTESLVAIPGLPPNLIDLPNQCPFLPRCQKAVVECRTQPRPPLNELAANHAVACYNPIVY